MSTPNTSYDLVIPRLENTQGMPKPLFIFTGCAETRNSGYTKKLYPLKPNTYLK